MEKIVIKFISYFLLTQFFVTFIAIFVFFADIHNRYNFSTCNHWCIGNTFSIIAILMRQDSNYSLFCTYNFYIPNDMFLYSIFDLNYMFYYWILQSYKICFIIVLASFLFVIILNALTFMYFVSFGTLIFGDQALQLAVHLLKLIMDNISAQ